MAGVTLVILHGLNGTGPEMAPLSAALDDFARAAPNLLGHGGRPVPERLRFEEMVADLCWWLAENATEPVHLVGYSFGGYLALAAALEAPERVLSLTAIATRFRWDEGAARHVVHLTDPERLARPGNPRREQMEAAHGAEVWRQVTLNNQALFADIAEEGAPLDPATLERIEAPALVLTGETDPLVPEAEARFLARALPNARLGLWPGSAHPLVNVPLIEVKYAFRAFASEVEEGRFAPGPPLRLKPRLTEGGVPNAGVTAEIRPRR